MSLQPGACLGPYESSTALGAGGMGEVYKARDARLERAVAVKVLPAALTDSTSARERFHREGCGEPSAPNTCTIHDVGADAPLTDLGNPHRLAVDDPEQIVP